MPNPYRAVWLTDPHMVSDNTEAGGTPPSQANAMHPNDSTILVQHIVQVLDPVICFDGGDCKDHYGTGAGVTDELDNYNTYLRPALRGTINPDAGVTATDPRIPGNHDEDWDYGDTTAGHTRVMSSWNAKVWGPPYHWTMDWAAPKIRIIALDTEIIHIVDPEAVANPNMAGWVRFRSSEVTWMAARVDELPADWTAVLLTHHPLLEAFGSAVRADSGGAALYAAMAARNTKIKAALSGHRHVTHFVTATQDSIRHINAPGLGYRLNNSLGAFTVIDYDPATRKLLFSEHDAPLTTDAPTYDSSTAQAVVEVQFPALTTSGNTIVSRVPVSTVPTVLLPAGAVGRRGVMLHSEAPSDVYVKLGTGVSMTDYWKKLGPDRSGTEYRETPARYNGPLTAVAAAPGGFVQVTEVI